MAGKFQFYLSKFLEYITLTVISFMHLNVWSPVVGLAWEGLTDVSLSEIVSLGVVFIFHKTCTIPSPPSLCVCACVCASWFYLRILTLSYCSSSILPACSLDSHGLSSSETITRKLNFFFSQLLCHGVQPQQWKSN